MDHLNFTNEDGEFLMTAAELRTEWELDALSAQERADEAWLDSWDDEEECDHSDGEFPDVNFRDDDTGYCPWCGEDSGTTCTGPEWDFAEDAHLDDTWE